MSVVLPALDHSIDGFRFTATRRDLRDGVKFCSHRNAPAPSDVAEATCGVVGWYAINVYPTLVPGNGFQGFDAVTFIYLGPVLPEFP